MNITLDPALLSKRRLHILTPMYANSCTGGFKRSCDALSPLLQQYGIAHAFTFLPAESLIPRGRNRLAAQFLKEGATDSIWIDADITFRPIDILHLLALDKPVIGAFYAKKEINWHRIKRAVLANPQIDPEKLHLFGAMLPANFTQDNFNLGELLPMHDMGTGILLVQRPVYERMAAEMPEIAFTPAPAEVPIFGSRGHAFFDTMIDPDTGVYQSEDFTFCWRWRKLGGEIFACPWMVTGHWGGFHYVCNLPAISEVLSEIEV